MITRTVQDTSTGAGNRSSATQTGVPAVVLLVSRFIARALSTLTVERELAGKAS